MLPRGGGSSAGVSSFDTRTGAVTFLESDLATGVAPGTSGNVLTSTGAAWASETPGSGGTISDITSSGGTLTVTGATGPTTNLDMTAADFSSVIAPGANTHVLTSNGTVWGSAAPPAGGTISDITSTYFGITDATGPTTNVDPLGIGYTTLTAGLSQTVTWDPNGQVFYCNTTAGNISLAAFSTVAGNSVLAIFYFIKTDSTAHTVTDLFSNVLTTKGDYSIIAYDTTNGTNQEWIVGLRIGGQTVTSVFGRTGAVVAAIGDYTAAQVTNAADKSSASTQTFTGIVGAPAGISTPVVTSGALPALSTIMPHAAAGTVETLGSFEQNLTGRDIVVVIIVATTTATSETATFQISPDNVTGSTVWKWLVPAAAAGIFQSTCVIRVPAGYFAAWITFSAGLSIQGTPNYY